MDGWIRNNGFPKLRMTENFKEQKMKKSFFNGLAAVLSAMFVLLTFSCESLEGLVQTPEVSMDSVSIAGLDLEGISFNANYSVKNPYGVSLSIAGLNADVNYKDTKITTLNSTDGIKVNASSTSSNKFSFKVPYETILKFASSLASGNASSQKTLPFDIDGNITLDVSNVPALNALGSNTVTLPIVTDFEVPVFKPKLSVSNFSVKMPTLNDLKDQLTKGGLGVTKALQVATTLLSGNKLSANIFDGIDMDIDVVFDVNVANEGGADWNLNIKNCALNTAAGSIADVGTADGSSTLSSDKSKVSMKASLNTIQAGAFIVQLLNKTGTNPTFELDTGLTFPETKYAKNIPLKYTAEIPLSSVGRK